MTVDVLIPEWIVIFLQRIRADAHAGKKLDAGVKKSYKVDLPLTEAGVVRHFDHAAPAWKGAYYMESGSSNTRLCTIDLDNHGGELSEEEMDRRANAVVECLKAHGWCPAVFRSSGGKGRHVTCYWDTSQAAIAIRRLAKKALAASNLEDRAGVAEVFPKQDSVPPGGYGNPVFFPIEMLSDWPWLPSKPVAYVPPREEPPMRTPNGALTPAGSYDLALAKAALLYIDAEDYHLWIKVGLALHHSFGGGSEAFVVWDTWSSKASNYEPGKCEEKWATFNASTNPVGLGSIFMRAELNGWPRAHDEQEAGAERLAALSRALNLPGVKDEAQAAANADYTPFPDALFDNLTGLPRQIADYLMTATFCPRKELAYAGMLSVLSLLVGPDCRVGKGKSKLNTYIVIIGNTGSGKSELLNAVVRLLVTTQAKDMVIDFPASEAGMRRQLSMSPSALVQADEISLKLEGMINNPGGGSLSMRSILEMWGAERLAPKSYADHRNDLPALERPHVCLLGASTYRFWQVLRPHHLDDGTINRMLFVLLPPITPFQYSDGLDRDVPPDLTKALDAFYRSTHVSVQDLIGNVPGVEGVKLPLRVIPMTDEAEKAMVNMLREVHGKAQDAMVSAYSRMVDYTVKVAGLLAYGEGRKAVDEKTFAQAEQFIRWTFANAIPSIREEVQGAQEKPLNFDAIKHRVLKFLKKAGGSLTRRQLQRHLGTVRVRDLNDVLEGLVDTGAVAVHNEETTAGQKTTKITLTGWDGQD